MSSDGGCTLYNDGSCSCARSAGVTGSCSSCKSSPVGAGAPHGGGGHHGGGHGGGHGHFGGGGGRHNVGGRWFGGWPRSWGQNVVVGPSSCTWVPPTGRVPPSVIAALSRQPFVNGWRTVFDDGWWAEQQSPNVYFVCVVAESAIGLYGLSADTTEAPTSTFPLWPMVAVGVVAVGLFVATLSIKKR